MNKYGFNIAWSDEDQGYIATCPEFPGLSAFGRTIEQALAEAQDALGLFIKTYQEDGLPLPEPQVIQEYSGQFRLRIPKTLHAKLARQAESEEVSLNTLAVSYLSEAMGVKAEERRQKQKRSPFRQYKLSRQVIEEKSERKIITSTAFSGDPLMDVEQLGHPLTSSAKDKGH